MSGPHRRPSARAPSITVAGGANVDLKVETAAAPGSAVSTPGRVHLCPGGAARNVAEALARMGASVRLLSAVGRDPWGEWLLAATTAAGVDCGRVLRRPEQTGIYVSVNGAGVADTTIIEATAPEEWPIPSGAAVLVLDANLSARSLSALAARSEKVAVIGTSPAKVERLRGVLNRCWLICLTASEAVVLAGRGAALQGEPLARAVQALGPAHVLVTEGPRGLGMLSGEWRTRPARAPEVMVDTTGAGDVAAATVIFGLATGQAPERMLTAAVEASALTVAGWGNVPPDVGTVWKRASSAEEKGAASR